MVSMARKLNTSEAFIYQLFKNKHQTQDVSRIKVIAEILEVDEKTLWTDDPLVVYHKKCKICPVVIDNRRTYCEPCAKKVYKERKRRDAKKYKGKYRTVPAPKKEVVLEPIPCFKDNKIIGYKKVLK